MTDDVPAEELRSFARAFGELAQLAAQGDSEAFTGSAPALFVELRERNQESEARTDREVPEEIRDGSSLGVLGDALTHSGRLGRHIVGSTDDGQPRMLSGELGPAGEQRHRLVAHDWHGVHHVAG